MQNNSLVIAIDPGYDRCGVALITDVSGKPHTIFSDCITTNKHDTHHQRLASIFNAVKNLVEEYNPQALALETLFFSVNKKTAIKVAEARGVIALVAGITGIPLIEIAPQSVKIALTGNGNATKEQVEKMVRLTITLPKKSVLDDEIDAIALGVAALGTLRHKNQVEAIAKKNGF